MKFSGVIGCLANEFVESPNLTLRIVANADKASTENHVQVFNPNSTQGVQYE